MNSEFDLEGLDLKRWAAYLRDELRKPKPHELPCLSAGFLVRHGYYQDQFTGAGFETKGVKVLPIRLFREVGLFTELGSEIFFSIVGLDIFTVGTVFKEHFVCPVTQQTCSKLYFHDYFWASSKGHGLRGGEGGKARRERREHLKRVTRLTTGPTHNRHHELRRSVEFETVRSELAELGGFPIGSDALIRVFVAEAKAASVRRRRAAQRAERHETSLELALERGCEVSPEALKGFVAAWHGEFSKPVWSADQSRQSLEQYPCLDMSTLGVSEMFRRSDSCAWSLGWPLWATQNEHIRLLSYDGPSEVGLLVELHALGGSVRYQKLEYGMRPNMRRRLFLKCPTKGTLHDKLYLRNGYFASASAHRLYPSSQS